MSFPLVRRSLAPAIVALAVGLAALWASSSAPAAQSANRSALAAASAAPSYLFSIPSAGGSLTGRNGQHLTLRLTGARRYLTRFTDAPLRQATVVANVDFARRFASYFADAYPNAVLTYTPAHKQIPVSVVVTIGHPRWNGRRAAWTFPATRIRKQTDNLPGTTVHINPPVIPNPHSFKHATLLIDDGATGPGIGSSSDDSGCGYTGEIAYFPASVVPGNFLDASGGQVDAAEYPDLYGVIGTRFGGNSTYFALPDVQAPAGLHAMICAAGRDPVNDSEEGPTCAVGIVKLFAQTDPVYGYLPTNGELVQISHRPTLGALLGTTFGGDGSKTFAVPTLTAPPGTTWQICASASTDGAGDPGPFMSEIGYWARGYVRMPDAWIPAVGQLLPISQNNALYGLIGAEFGGDGHTNFAMPRVTSPTPGVIAGIDLEGVYPPPR